jgi:SAM-dependent methyltransferase
MTERSCPSINEASRRKIDGKLESATRTTETRVRQQLPWLSHLPTDFLTVLDIGPGAGYHSKYFLERGKCPTVLERYADAFQFNKEIPLVTKDLFEFESAEPFDAVFCSHVLADFPDPAFAIQKMRSLIRPDGYLFVVMPPYQPMVVTFIGTPDGTVPS